LFLDAQNSELPITFRERTAPAAINPADDDRQPAYTLVLWSAMKQKSSILGNHDVLDDEV